MLGLGKTPAKLSWLLSVSGTAIALGLLAWLGERNYLTFHSLAELYSIIVSAAVFVIAWNVRDTIDNGYLQFLGIAFLFVAAIDLSHMLAYNGMGVFPGYGADLPTQLWIAGRMLQAVSLLAAPVFLHVYRCLCFRGLREFFSRPVVPPPETCNNPAVPSPEQRHGRTMSGFAVHSLFGR